MIYYLLDTTAVVLEYNPKGTHRLNVAKNFIKGIQGQRKKKEAIIFLPDLCVVEAFKTLSKWLCKPGEKLFTDDEKEGKTAYDQYKKAYDQLEGAVKGRQLYYVYDLHRYHVLNCDEIFEKEHTTPLERDPRHPEQAKPGLSTCDILVIAMGMELTKIHGDQSVYIVTGDDRQIRIARELRADRQEEFAQVLNPYEDPVPYEQEAFLHAGRAKRS